MRTIQEASNEIAKKAGYKGDFMTTQSALNYIAENIGVFSSGVGGEEELTPDEGFVDKNTGVIIDEWLGEQEEYDSAIKFANRRYSIYSKQGELLKQYCTRFKSPLDYFDNRLSMYLSVGENGLSYWNNPNDPMPILGLDMSKGIEYYCKDFVPNVYKIYTDGEVLDVMGYAGLGDLYNDAMKTIYEEEIARGVDIQSANHITSNKEFHRMLVEQLNKDNIARVESMPVTLDENGEEIQPLVKSMQRVITAINFCCRVDLEDGSIYIGEGYENLLSSFQVIDHIPAWGKAKCLLRYTNTKYLTVDIYDIFAEPTNILNVDVKSIEFCASPRDSVLITATSGDTVYSEYANNGGRSLYSSSYANIEDDIKNKGFYTASVSAEDMTSIGVRIGDGNLFQSNNNTKKSIVTNRCQITKTTTHKPFVKSHLPSGKLAFITNATSETHSFVMKGIISNVNTKVVRPLTFLDDTNGVAGNFEYADSYFENNLRHSSFVASETFRRIYSNGSIFNISSTITTTGKPSKKIALNVQESYRKIDSFSQLLIYKGNFTQVELEGELEKDIRLK